MENISNFEYISLKAALNYINTNYNEDGEHITFGLEYYKKNGEYGKKELCSKIDLKKKTNRATQNTVKRVKSVNNTHKDIVSRIIRVFDIQTNRNATLKTDLLVAITFNGKRYLIDHQF